MSVNPYRTPADADETRSVDPSLVTKRPLGISLMAVLHLLGGLGVLWVVFFIETKNPQQLEAGLNEVGTTFYLVAAGFVFIAAIQIASGVGLWRGVIWGWRLAVFYYVYCILRHVEQFAVLAAMSEQMVSSGRGTSYYFNRIMFRMIFKFLFLSLLFQKSSLKYFGLRDMNFLKEIALPIGGSVAVYAVNFFVSGLLG